MLLLINGILNRKVGFFAYDHFDAFAHSGETKWKKSYFLLILLMLLLIQGEPNGEGPIFVLMLLLLLLIQGKPNGEGPILSSYF